MRSVVLAAVLVAVHGIAACASTSPPPAAPAPSTASSAPSAPAAAKQAAPSALKASGEATIGDRTKCPTSGEEFVVTADSPKVDYKGKTYYFCCGGCDKKFASDPEKYLSKPDT